MLQRGVAVWPRSPRQSGRGPGGTRSSGRESWALLRFRRGGAREQPQLWASGVMLGCSVTPRSGTLLSSSRPGGGPRARRPGTSRPWLVPQARGSLPGPGWPGCQTSQLPLAVTVVLGGGVPLRPQCPALCPRAHLQLRQPLCSSHPKVLPVYFRRPDHTRGLLPNSHPSSHLSYIP